MDERDQTIGFRATKTEKAELENSAQRVGMNLAEYVRAKVFAPAKMKANDDLEALVKHGIWLANQIHEALYSIAEAEGKARRFLTTAELGEVYDRVKARALGYAVEFDQKFAAVQALVAAGRQEQGE